MNFHLSHHSSLVTAIALFALPFASQGQIAQTLGKDFRDLTPEERTAFVAREKAVGKAPQDLNEYAEPFLAKQRSRNTKPTDMRFNIGTGHYGELTSVMFTWGARTPLIEGFTARVLIKYRNDTSEERYVSTTSALRDPKPRINIVMELPKKIYSIEYWIFTKDGSYLHSLYTERTRPY